MDPRGPAAGASRDNAGMLRTLSVHAEERQRAVWTARRLARWPEVFAQTGSVIALQDDDGRHDDGLRHLASLDWPIRVDRPATLTPLLASSSCRWAVSVPGDGVVDAPALVRRLLHGLTVLPTPSGAVDVEVVATGAWAAPEAGLVALRRHLLVSEPTPAAQGPWVWIDDAGVYLRPDRGRFLASACDEEVAAADPPRGPATEHALQAVERAVAASFPALRLSFRAGAFGLRTFAPDRRPVAGPDPDVPGRWRLLGLGGSGVSTALALGHELAAAIVAAGGGR